MNKDSLIFNNSKHPFFKRVKSLMAPTYLDFVFQIFKERVIPVFYENEISNKITNEKLKISTSPRVVNLKNKIYIITDVPSFLNVDINNQNEISKVKKIPQYKGFLIKLNNYKSLNDYLVDKMGRASRKKIRSKERKLMENHNITYKFHYGEISKEHYNLLFDAFKKMLQNRFEEKQTYNKNLSNWNYYYELAYPMILNKTASLFVIYDHEKPINIALNFHDHDILFSYMQTFDIDYSDYNLGYIDMSKHIEWCINNNISIIDLSKGDSYFKRKWSNYTYGFEYHILYDKKSVMSSLIANAFSLKLKFKQFLRDKNIERLYQRDKVMYRKLQKNNN